MRPFNVLRLAALAVSIAAAALAGCGGGGASLIPHSSGSATSAGALANATLHIVVPEKTTNGKRRPAYISPSTTQLAWYLDSVQQTPVALTTSNPECTSGGSGLSCVVGFNVAPGAHTFSFALEDSNGTTLSANTDVSATLTAGSANTINVTLGGVAYSFSVTSASTNIAGSGLNRNVFGVAPVSLTINALDADGNTIVGAGSLGVTAALSNVPATPAPSVSPSVSPLPTVSPLPATATLVAGTNNTWTLTSTYHATSPTVPGVLSLVVSASPVPNSGQTSTLTTKYNLSFWTPWLFVSQRGSGKVLSYDEQGSAQSTVISGIANPASVIFAESSSTATPVPSPYIYVAAVTTSSPVPTPTGSNTPGPSSGAIKAYNGDGTTPTLSGSFSGAGVPAGLAFDTNLNYLYLVNSPGTSLQAYDMQGNATSVITSTPTISGPTGIVFVSANNDLYVSTTSGVFAYMESGAVDSSVSAFAGVSSPAGIAYDSNLQEMAVLNGNGTVTLYALTGGTARTTFSVLSSPTAIVFDPYSLWFYVANASSIKAYSETGTLQTLSGSWSGLSSPSGLTVVQ
jgi:hypothetical protein